MLVVHAHWTAGALHFWGESADAWRSGRASVDGAPGTAPAQTGAAAHPFAATIGDLRAALGTGAAFAHALAGDRELRLFLPTCSGRPRPSDRLAGFVGAEGASGPVELAVHAVPAIALRPAHTLDALVALTALTDGAASASLAWEGGHAVRYWGAVAELVLELLADQRFIPTVMQASDGALTAGWQPWLHDAWTRTRVAELLGAMPPIVRSVDDEHEGRPWSILDDALRSLTDATVRRMLLEEDFAEAIGDRDRAADPHVAWLAALVAEEDRMSAPPEGASAMLRDVGRWIGVLDDAARDRPLRLCFVLREPPAPALDDVAASAPSNGGNERWSLVFALRASGEGSEIVEAERLWRDPGAARALIGGSGAGGPEELLLAELARAGRLYPNLEPALRREAPSAIELDTFEAYAFLSDTKPILEESGFDVIAPEWWRRSEAQLALRLRVEAKDPMPDARESGRGGTGTAAALLGLDSLVRTHWQVALGERVLGLDEFRALAGAARGSLVRMHGRWVEIRPDQAAAAVAFIDGEPDREVTLLEAIQLAYGARGAEIGLPVVGMEATGWVAELLEPTGVAQLERVAQPTEFVGQLRPYQVLGLSWLAFLDRFGLGACLADDMGLGKTIQLIALLLHERERRAANAATSGAEALPLGPTLLVVPTSVVSNWQRELARFAPRLSVHIHHGPGRPLGDQLIELVAQRDVVITTYTLISRDRETLQRVPWHRVVLDEAQYIKNPPTKQTSTIRALDTKRRIALTGTPVENRLSELWSIMEFCNPGYLGPAAEFRRRFAGPIERHRDRHRAEQLRGLVRPFVLRRLKSDPGVIDDLPECVVTREYATLTAEQAALYESTVGAMLGRVAEAEGIQRRGLVLATLVRLKQICNHPAQIAGAQLPGSPGGPPADEALSHRSGKCRRLIEMLEEVLATGDQALIFTQFRQMGHLLTAMLRHDLDVDVLFLHGGTPQRNRQEMIDRFQDRGSGTPLFVLSLKAGGLGLNLTAANHVFHFDRWWNPAVENQATDRAHRIGQTRTVHVHKFVCLGTLEERIDQMLEQKAELAENVIGTGEDWLTELSTVQLRELFELRQSAMEIEA